MLSARNRELLGLGPAALLITGGFAAIFIQSQNRLSNVSLTYGLFFLALCVAAHIAVRICLPQADPVSAAVGGGPGQLGLVMLYRINPTLAREQAQWFVLGLILFVATLIIFRGRPVRRARALPLHDRPRSGIVGLVIPRLPGIGQQVNGAYLNIKLGPIAFQPSELAKIAIVIFLASYLRDNRQVLVTGGQRLLGLTIPPMKQFGPLLVDLGRRDGDAPDHRRARDVADVLRGDSRPAVRRDRPPVVSARRARPVRARRVVRRDPRLPRPRPGPGLGAPVRQDAVRSEPSAGAISLPRASSRRPTAVCSAPASTSRCSTRQTGIRSSRCRRATSSTR